MAMNLDWMKEIIFGNDTAIAAFGPDPFGFVVNGKRMAIATDGRLMVAVPTDAELPAPRDSIASRADSMQRYLTVPAEAEPYDANLVQLKRWAGVPLGHDIYFDHDGYGPYTVPNHRSCVLYGVPLDANLLAHALQAFEGESVKVYVGGEADPVRIADERGAVAVIMPRRIPRWTAERGPIGGYGVELLDPDDSAERQRTKE